MFVTPFPAEIKYVLPVAVVVSVVLSS